MMITDIMCGNLEVRPNAYCAYVILERWLGRAHTKKPFACVGCLLLLLARYYKKEIGWLARRDRQKEIEPRKLMSLGWKSHLDIRRGRDQTLAHNLLEPSCYVKDYSFKNASGAKYLIKGVFQVCHFRCLG